MSRGKQRPSLGDIHATGRLQERVSQAQAAILQVALKEGVQVSFGEGRRASDVAMALLKGERQAVLSLPPRFEDELEFDLHVVRSAFNRETFELLVVLVEPLDDQTVRSPERRAALRQRLARQTRDPDADDLLDLGDA